MTEDLRYNESQLTRLRSNLGDLEEYNDLHFHTKFGYVAIHKLLFTYGLVIGLDSTSYFGRWCFDSYEECLLSLSRLNEIEGLIATGNWRVFKSSVMRDVVNIHNPQINKEIPDEVREEQEVLYNNLKRIDLDFNQLYKGELDEMY